MFEPFHEVLARPADTVRSWAEALGRPVVGVMPAYFPLELVWAAGGFPVQLWGNRLPIERADSHLQSYCCSVARSVLELELRGGAEMVAAYAFTSLCDTLVNLREVYRRLFDKPAVALSIPATQTAEARRRYLEGQVGQVLEDLAAVTGTAADQGRLAEAARLYGRRRRLQRELYERRRRLPGAVSAGDFYAALKAGFFLPPEPYERMLSELLAWLDQAAPAEAAAGPRLVASGMVFDPLSALAIFDELGAAVADDDFANGWRSAAKGPLETGDLVSGVSEYLFGPAPCCCIYRPENDRLAYLVDKVRQAGARGVVFWYTKFCEPDAFDRPQLAAGLKAAGIASVTVELELSMTNFDAVRTRLAAFCEMLEG